MSAVINVSSLSALYTALANAKGGETIALAAGNYGKLDLGPKSGFDITFPSNVTITSADPDDPAVFSGAQVRGAENLTFDSVTFDYTFKAGDPVYLRPFAFSDCSNLTIRDAVFDGDVASGVSAIADGRGNGMGISVSRTDGLTLENNEVFNFHRGMMIGGCDNVVVKNNEVHSIRSDGMDFAGVQNVLIQDNYIHDFTAAVGSSDHRDMIQFWTAGGGRPTENVVIRGNRLDIGDGNPTQSIFMRNEWVDTGKGGREMFYRNILIEENVITNGHLHGITVGETAGLTIRNNTILHSDGGIVDGLDEMVEIPRINLAGASTSVSILSNATSGISGYSGQAGWIVSGNAFVQDQDPLAPGYYANEFLTSSLDAGADPVAVTGGILDTLDAGATLTRLPLASDAVLPLFHVETDPTDLSVRIFDATDTISDTGSLPAGTKFLWKFGDGTSVFGAVVAHQYTDPGKYDVTLTVILPNKTAVSTGATVKVSSSDILSLGDTGFVAYENDATIALAADSNIDAAGLHLLAKGVAVSVGREHVRDIFHADDFGIDFSLQSQTATSKGEVFRIHGSMVASVDGKGAFQLRTWTTDGVELRLNSANGLMTDKKMHSLSIAYEDDVLSLTVDGKVVDTVPMKAPLAASSGQGLFFGNPWGQANFTGLVSSFEISRSVDDFPSQAQTAVLQAAFDVPQAALSLAPAEALTLAFDDSAPLDDLSASHLAAALEIPLI